MVFDQSDFDRAHEPSIEEVWAELEKAERQRDAALARAERAEARLGTLEGAVRRYKAAHDRVQAIDDYHSNVQAHDEASMARDLAETALFQALMGEVAGG